MARAARALALPIDDLASGPDTSTADPGQAARQAPQRLVQQAFVRTVVNSRSRVAYAEIHDDETAHTAAGSLRQAVFWFAARGVTVHRVLTDNDGCYRSHLRPEQCSDLDITYERTRPYCRR